ncbi:hypothetical protein RSO41_12320 [Halomonas sp. I1]|uniref:hypothetical protein n=1 Tax=Halomonas sp. I1 TaxID=393536 RepID=UPI0028DF0071|nr:hypothetical protein [Halomonas sp. I1]MDT8895441.1 hypothetical protein [Halomonas sp. I1]
MSIDIDKLEALAKRTSMWGQASTIIALIARLREAERGRDAYEDMAHGMSADLTTMGEERDALAAHVERLTSALVKIDTDLEGRNFLEDSSLRDTCREALADTPTNSLARLKARWQVEVLQHMLGRARRNGDRAVVDAVEESIAIELRRQAGIGEGAP